MDDQARWSRVHHQRRRNFLLLYLLDIQDLRFRELLDDEGRLRRDRRIPRIALLSPTDSPWAKLYASGNNQALITTTGFDHKSFRTLVELFAPWFKGNTPWTGKQDGTTFKKLSKYTHGRSRIIDTETCVGLVLTWYRFRGGEFVLQGWFGFTANHANVWLRFGRRGLLKVLSGHPLARVEFPSSTEQVHLLCKLVELRHNMLPDVAFVMDGVKLMFEKAEDLDEQSMYYNGWTHDHYITNVFCFGADGTMVAAAVNAPGSMHDSTIAEYGSIYSQLEDIYQRTGAKCCVDSAFSAAERPYIVKSSENVLRAGSPEQLIQQEQATSLRQASEWGMRVVQSAFCRLKDRIHLEDNGERRVFLLLMPLLYNIRLNLVGLNQLRNTYVPMWSVDSSYFIHK
ncbi:unknown protein [Seminavis robusta]|uniref:DDE Tnp4 domain-containing protein n=1 Tax=Seminavis robusta TaxID=568900 RepID=A0A9N8E4T7_9STRA|nr:unknown protein [Seminavis robusta]|eukprot:Sro502_g155510.1 n/a (398) ;mRNA; f:12791-13984